MKRLGRASLLLVVGVFMFCYTIFSGPSEKSTILFLAEKQKQIEDFIEMMRVEVDNLDSIYLDGNTLSGINKKLEWNVVSVSAELQSKWDEINSERNFTGMSCDFEENDSLCVHFSCEEKWVPYEEGHYRNSFCLIWLDNNCPRSPGGFWRQLTQEDGITSSSVGSWYFYNHKHYDG